MEDGSDLVHEHHLHDGCMALGVGEQKAALRVATVRVALVRERGPAYADPIESATDVYRLLGPVARSWDREHLVVFVLDGRGHVAGIDEVSIGTVTAALVHPREIFKTLILANAVSFIIAHNHPSGDPTPSKEDHTLTQRIKEASELMGIRLLDHVIISATQYHSMQEAGEL